MASSYLRVFLKSLRLLTALQNEFADSETVTMAQQNSSFVSITMVTTRET